MGFTIQAGAFSKAENAVRLTEQLIKQGLDATYFSTPTGFYKVHIGNFNSKAAAIEKAESIKSTGIIDDYYVVSPSDYSIAKEDKLGTSYVRQEIVKTARSFIGVPYLWAGSSYAGFDCSGLSMTTYKLNGLDLPRSSIEQYDLGIPIRRDELSLGDLVFFATSPKNKVSHVGIYVGEGRFVHAPSKGKNIREDFLSNKYFKKIFVGARTYL